MYQIKDKIKKVSRMLKELNRVKKRTNENSGGETLHSRYSPPRTIENNRDSIGQVI